MSGVRRSTALAALVLALALAGAAAAVHATARRAGAAGALAVQARLVRELGLTDLCLFTEARYTRHPSQADAFAPFQDHPRALDHFPSGALAGRPRAAP